MQWNEITEEFDKLDFCLQKSGGEIIVTLLINQVPLYDCIIKKSAEFTCLTKEEKNKFFLESYNFNNFPDVEIDDEELFYHNYPQNLSPVDYKHPFIGLGVCFTYHLLVSQYTELEMFYLNGEKIEINDFSEIYFDTKKQLLFCLCCACGSIDCSSFSMEIKKNKGKIEWINFYNFSDYLHEKVSFQFEEKQYFEVLQQLKLLNDNLKTYEDYSNFEIERWNNTLSKKNDCNI